MSFLEHSLITVAGVSFIFLVFGLGFYCGVRAEAKATRMMSRITEATKARVDR